MAKQKKSDAEDPNDQSAPSTNEAAALEGDTGAQEELRGIGEIAIETYDLNRKQLAELADGIRERTRQRPLKSLFMAGGAGVLIGILWG